MPFYLFLHLTIMKTFHFKTFLACLSLIYIVLISGCSDDKKKKIKPRQLVTPYLTAK